MNLALRVLTAPLRWARERVMVELGLADQPRIVNVHGPTTIMEGVSAEELQLAIDRALVGIKRPEVQKQMRELHAQRMDRLRLQESATSA